MSLKTPSSIRGLLYHHSGALQNGHSLCLLYWKPWSLRLTRSHAGLFRPCPDCPCYRWGNEFGNAIILCRSCRQMYCSQFGYWLWRIVSIDSRWIAIPRCLTSGPKILWCILCPAAFGFVACVGGIFGKNSACTIVFCLGDSYLQVVICLPLICLTI